MFPQGNIQNNNSNQGKYSWKMYVFVFFCDMERRWVSENICESKIFPIAKKLWKKQEINHNPKIPLPTMISKRSHE